MPQSPKDFIEIAKDLRLSAQNEAALRACISRAYYGAHHALHPLFSTCLVNCTPANSDRVGHREAFRWLEAWKVKDPKLEALKHAAMIAAKQLKAAIALRERADYRLGENISTNDADIQQKRAEDVVNFAERALKQMQDTAA